MRNCNSGFTKNATRKLLNVCVSVRLRRHHADGGSWGGGGGVLYYRKCIVHGAGACIYKCDYNYITHSHDWDICV